MNQEQKDNFELSPLLPIAKMLGIDECDIIYRNQDKPDNIITKYEGKRIGVEVVTCHPSYIDSGGKRNYLQRYSYLSDLVKQYKKRLYQNGDRKNLICVSFKWKAYWDWDNDNIILEEIDDCINGRLRKYWRYIDNAKKKDVDFENDNEICITESHIGNGAQLRWITHCVVEKEQKLQGYKELEKNKNIDEYWLIVDFVYAQNVDLNKTDQFEIDTEYDRLYLVQYGDVKRLK